MPHRIEIPAGVLNMFRTELDSANSLPMEISRTIPRLAFKYGERIAQRMAAEDSLSAPELLRRITLPLAGLILVLVAAALFPPGLTAPLGGWGPSVPAATLIAAGAYQVTRTKEVCLTHCQSPMGFVTLHWRSGRLGSVRMGLRHAAYCLGCCWLFMIALFVAGAMSLVWMGVLSVAIFAAEVTTRPVAVSRGIAALLPVRAGILAVRRVL